LQAELRGFEHAASLVEAIEDEGTRRPPRSQPHLAARGLAMLLIALVARFCFGGPSVMRPKRATGGTSDSKDMPAFVALDMAQVRGAGPPAAMQMILSAAQPLFRRLGAKPSELGQIAAPSRRGRPTALPAAC